MLGCTSWFADYALNMAAQEKKSEHPAGCSDVRKRPTYVLGKDQRRAYRAAVRAVEAGHPRGVLDVHSGRRRRVAREGAIKRIESHLTIG